MIKFLVAPALATLGSAGGIAPEQGEPVVPWYMPSPPNMFVSTVSFKFTPYATVAELELDLDSVAAKLQAQYPGLPILLHENYVMATALAAAGLSTGTHVRPLITAESASIQVINSTKVVQLWTQPPTKGKV